MYTQVTCGAPPHRTTWAMRSGADTYVANGKWLRALAHNVLHVFKRTIRRQSATRESPASKYRNVSTKFESCAQKFVPSNKSHSPVQAAAYIGVVSVFLLVAFLIYLASILLSSSVFLADRSHAMQAHARREAHKHLKRSTANKESNKVTRLK